MDPNDFEPGPLADVSSEATGDRWTLVFRRDLRHPPEKVWSALTDPEQVAAWAPFHTDRDLGSTGGVMLSMFGAGERLDIPASVIRAEAPRLLDYTWGEDLLRWELEPTDTGTHVTLRHTVESAEWVPKVAAGWHLCLVVADHLLDGDPIAPIRGEEAMDYGWQELHDAYATELLIDPT